MPMQQKNGRSLGGSHLLGTLVAWFQIIVLESDSETLVENVNKDTNMQIYSLVFLQIKDVLTVLNGEFVFSTYHVS